VLLASANAAPPPAPVRLKTLGAADEAAVTDLLNDLFGSQENLLLMARNWQQAPPTREQQRDADAPRREQGLWTRVGRRANVPPSSTAAWPWARVQHVRHPLQMLWMRTTRLLSSRGLLPFNGKEGQPGSGRYTKPGCGARKVDAKGKTNVALTPCLPGVSFKTDVSVHRLVTDRWNVELNASLGTSALPLPHADGGLRCAETGDGHYLRTYYSTRCTRGALSMDKFDRNANVPLDLGLPPEHAHTPSAVRESFGSVDLLVSHSVFEHLPSPAVAMATLNRLLRVGGVLVWSTPWMAVHHGSNAYDDYRRVSTTGAAHLLRCAGFNVTMSWGVGSLLGVLSYLTNASPNEMTDADLFQRCDGLSRSCLHSHYVGTMAAGVKLRDVSSQEVAMCA